MMQRTNTLKKKQKKLLTTTHAIFNTLCLNFTESGIFLNWNLTKTHSKQFNESQCRDISANSLRLSKIKKKVLQMSKL